MEPVLSALVPFLSAAFGTGLAAYLALGQFRRQKLWESKFSSYSDILDALHQMTLYSSAIVEAHIQDRDLSKDKDQELASVYRGGQDKVWKVIFVGGLILPEPILKRLRQLMIDLRKVEDIDDYMGAVMRDSELLHNAIEELISAARQDLRRTEFFRCSKNEKVA